MESNLLVIKFYKSNSINYEHATRIAKRFSNYVQEEKASEIKIAANEIFEKINDIEQLLSFIASWKYTEYTFNDRLLQNSNFNNISQTIKCAKKYHKSLDKSTHCYLYEDKKEGWRCKFLTKMTRHIPSRYYDYIRRPHHWFNYGHFEDNFWIINKDLIKQKLKEEIDEKFLEVCPHFSFQNIEKILDSFPDKIDIDNSKEWCIDEQEVDTGYSLEKKKAGIMPKRIAVDMGNTKVFDPNSGWSSLGKDRFPDIYKKTTEGETNWHIPSVSFDEIGGLGDTIKIIRQVIELPISQPKLFEHLGIVPHKGILLYGPPGCGKTLIAKAIANKINAHFIDIKGPELFSKWLGQSEEKLRKVFNEARDFAPSIIFFDEIDAIAQKRSSDDSQKHYSVFVNQLLTLMDGVEEYSNVRIIAATNMPELLDDAILRPGRFDYHLEIKNPTLEGCKEILKIYTKKMPISEDFNLDRFGEKLVGLSGADINFITKEAAYNCIRRNTDSDDIIQNDYQFDLQNFIIQEQDFLLALSKAKR